MNDDKYKNEIDEEIRRADYAARAGFWVTYKWVVAAIIAVLAIIAGVFAWSVLIAKPQGAGEAYKTNQSGTNRIAKQEMFEQLYADIQNADNTVGLMAAAKLDDPSYVNRTNYTAARAHCNELVTNYDAEARKYTSQDWRDNKLPSAINTEDPKFDCKEAK